MPAVRDLRPDPGAPIPTQENPAPSSANLPGRNYRTDEDAPLVKRMGDGDPHALGTLYDRLSVSIYTHVLQLIGNPAEAEDVVEETFWNAWRKAKGYEPTLSPVSAWILGMARRRAVESRSLKTKNRPATAEAGKPAVQSAPSLPAFEKLPPEQREAIALAFLKGMAYEEIAGALKVPVVAIEASTRAGMDALGASLRPVVADAAPSGELPE